MIIQCNSCQKSFNVPDSAITSSGRLVQCSSCGNKWTQYPISKKNEITPKVPKQKVIVNKPKSTKPKKIKNIKKKKKENPYTEDYLKKKHGLKIIDPSSSKIKSSTSKKLLKGSKKNSSIGFYGSLLIFIIFIITLFGILSLTKEIIIINYPIFEPHINYLYETIENIKIIFSDFISNY
ncbi:MAG: zinc-ribbon domain-containing protein [Pelagibacteraceae bacterium]